MVHIRNLRRKIEENPQKPKMIATLWGSDFAGYLGERGFTMEGRLSWPDVSIRVNTDYLSRSMENMMCAMKGRLIVQAKGNTYRICILFPVVTRDRA